MCSQHDLNKAMAMHLIHANTGLAIHRAGINPVVIGFISTGFILTENFDPDMCSLLSVVEGQRNQ